MGRPAMRSLGLCCTLLILLLTVIYPGDGYGLERFDVVTTEQLSSLLRAKENGTADFALVNTLDRVIYNDQSIPGSVNVPWSEITGKNLIFGEKTDRLIITHCMGYR